MQSKSLEHNDVFPEKVSIYISYPLPVRKLEREALVSGCNLLYLPVEPCGERTSEHLRTIKLIYQLRVTMPPLESFKSSSTSIRTHNLPFLPKYNICKGLPALPRASDWPKAPSFTLLHSGNFASCEPSLCSALFLWSTPKLAWLGALHSWHFIFRAQILAFVSLYRLWPCQPLLPRALLPPSSPTCPFSRPRSTWFSLRRALAGRRFCSSWALTRKILWSCRVIFRRTWIREVSVAEVVSKMQHLTSSVDGV